jgi:uncharacterized protein YjbI with pentapeptide repeats
MLLWGLVAIIVLAGFVVIVTQPKYWVRDDGTLTKKEILELRDKMRATAAQIAGGLALAVTFFHTVIQSNEDLAQKKSQQFTDQLAKALSELTNDDQWTTIGSILILGDIAKNEKIHHQTIFQVVSDYARTESIKQCTMDRVYDESETDFYTVRPRIQTAMRIFADRNPNSDAGFGDEYRRKFNLSNSCLVGVDLYRGYGLAEVFMPSAILRRANMQESIMRSATLSGITAGDRHNPNWNYNVRQRILNRPSDDNDDLYKQFITNFYSADLTGAHLEKAGLEGADLRKATLSGATMARANISRADLRDAVVTWKELRVAECSDDHDPPLLDDRLRSSVLQSIKADPEAPLARSSCRF